MVSSPLLLFIDTTSGSSQIALAAGNQVLASDQCLAQQDQAPWLQPAIGRLFETAGLRMAAIDAVAVSAGPGSYTGLRIGMASAKGICFALNKPLIALDTLKIMAAATVPVSPDEAIICPQIDARRLEVFTAVYNRQLTELEPPQALILTEKSYARWLADYPVIVTGSGAVKCKSLLKYENALYVPLPATLSASLALAAESFASQAFANLVTAEPFYVKAFYTPAKANS